MIRPFGAVAFLAVLGCTSGGNHDGEREAELLDRAARDFLHENYSSAAFRYEQFLRLNPETPKRAWILAQVGLCRNGAGDFEGAIRAFDEALKAGSDAVLRLQIRFRRAVSLNLTDRPESALLDLAEVEAAPKDRRENAVKSAEFLRTLGVTAMRAGQWARGQKTLQQLVEQDPQNPEAATARALLAMKTFSVQVAGGVDERSAAGKVSELKSKGVVARAVALPERSGVSILVGEFSRYPEAVRERERLKALGIPGFVLP